MRLKADCLFDAGVISAEDRRTVYACSRAVLGFAHQDAPARADLRSDAQAAALMH